MDDPRKALRRDTVELAAIVRRRKDFFRGTQKSAEVRHKGWERLVQSSGGQPPDALAGSCRYEWGVRVHGARAAGTGALATSRLAVQSGYDS